MWRVKFNAEARYKNHHNNPDGVLGWFIYFSLKHNDQYAAQTVLQLVQALGKGNMMVN